MKAIIECLVCNGKIEVQGKGEQVDELLQVWDSQHKPCRDSVPAPAEEGE